MDQGPASALTAVGVIQQGPRPHQLIPRCDLVSPASSAIEHGDFTSKERESVSIFHFVVISSLMILQAYIWTVRGAVLQFRRIPLILRNNRYYTPRYPQTGVFTEVIRRKSGQRITEGEQPNLGTSPTPVCLLPSNYGHFLTHVRV